MTNPSTSRDDLVAALDAFFRVDDVDGDEWDEIFKLVYETPHWRDYVEPAWRTRWNGLMIRGAEAFTAVATCVFPNDEIIARLKPRTFLFTEHPLDDAAGDVFAPWSRASFDRMQKDGISVYTAHAPLDQHAKVSPSRLIAHGLGLTAVDAFLPVCARIPGGTAVIGDSALTVSDLAARLQSVLGADIPVRLVSAPRERAGRVAVVAGGGASEESLAAALARGCTTYVTGNAASPCHIPFVKDIHARFSKSAAAAGVAVIDGTHYGTEKPSQLAMLDWFRARGIDATFEAGKPERG